MHTQAAGQNKNKTENKQIKPLPNKPSDLKVHISADKHKRPWRQRARHLYNLARNKPIESAHQVLRAEMNAIRLQILRKQEIGVLH